ncbi:hypothetical protein MLD38_023012 [Melastoma candidum]|uniref:Uncharacterized protein n=1 Tax=Melastoma candidum TaxID=119954 RepID=A0ACB9QP73_9MYRT|nr:hypothetical protein MLD38_023012 [Melastoma candidum]
MESDSRHSLTKKKRKPRRSSPERPSKFRGVPPALQRPGSVEDVEEKEGVRDVVPDIGDEWDHLWRELDLILLLQNKDVDLQRKIESVHSFALSRVHEEVNCSDGKCAVVDLSQLVSFVSEWVQSLLISSLSGKKTRSDGKQLNEDHPWLDLRCWEVLEFSLQKSSELQVNLNLHHKLLNPVSHVARHTLAELTASDLLSRELSISNNALQLFNVVVRCAHLLFRPYAGLTNESMVMWLSITEQALELVNQVFIQHLQGHEVGDLVLQFSCSVLEPFGKYLCVHPPRKTVFSDFVTKLMEPLLQLLGHLCAKTSNNSRSNKLLILTEGLLSYGLFHPMHVDGFLTLNSLNKYLVAPDENSRSSRTTIISYHRHFFLEYGRIIDSRKYLALSGAGHLFHVLAGQVKKLKGAPLFEENIGSSANSGDMKTSQDKFSHKKTGAVSRTHAVDHDTNYGFVSLSPEYRKSLFDFFVETMEPVVYKLNYLLKSELEVTSLPDLCHMLKAANSILCNFIVEKVYVRGEDILGGGSLVFLRKVYEMILSISTRLYSVRCTGDYIGFDMYRDILTSLSVELVTSMDYLLEIEYKVYGKDLAGLWHLMLIHLAMGLHLKESKDRSLLIDKVVCFGCKLVNLYGDLRQVMDLIFALCSAARLLNASMRDSGINPHEYVDAVGILASSKDFRLALSAAISAIPEGQASRCIQQVAEDMSGTSEWLKVCCLDINGQCADGVKFDVDSLQGFCVPFQLLGGLSDIYCCMLDSCNVTSGNSRLIGSSMENLLSVIGTSLPSLVGSPSRGVKKFLYSVLGKKPARKLRKHCYVNFQSCAYWASLFFLRLFMSARSLCRQIISLMPPNSAKKFSINMGDSSTAPTGKDSIERTDWIDEGYFSWIVKPSSSLQTVFQSVSDGYVQGSAPEHYPLFFVFHMMAIQRLVDLNRLIKSVEYVARHDLLMPETNLASSGNQKLEKDISILRQEAHGLTNVLMGYLKSIADAPCFSASLKIDEQGLLLWRSTEWDLGVSSVTEESYPAAFWGIICKNIDVWCVHAAKKDLMVFLSLLIRTLLLAVMEDGGTCTHPRQLPDVSVGAISLAVLCDVTFYEHRFVRRHFPSRFCSMIEKLLEGLSEGFPSSGDLCSSQNWDAVLCTLEKSLPIVRAEANALELRQMDHPVINDTQCAVNRPESIPESSQNYAVCTELIKLLCLIPKEHINSKSLSCYANCILSTERLVVSSLLENNGASHPADVSCRLKLLLSCRRALNYLLVSFKSGRAMTKLYGIPILFERSHVALWLLKSVVLLGLPDSWAHNNFLFQDDMLSLLDHTFNIFSKLGDYYFSEALRSLLKTRSSEEERDSHMDHVRNSDDGNSASLILQRIKGEMQELYGFLECTVREEKLKACSNSLNLSRTISVLSFLNGLLWGAVSALNNVGGKVCGFKVIGSPLSKEVLSDINSCMTLFVSIAGLFLDKVLISDEKRQPFADGAQNIEVSHHRQPVTVTEPLAGGDASADKSNITSRGHSKGDVITFLESYEFPNGSIAASGKEHSSGDNSSDQEHVDVAYLQNMVKGDNHTEAFLLRQLFLGFSAILKLQAQGLSGHIFPNMMRILLEVSQVLIEELLNRAVLPHSFSYVWLDGVFMYLEHLGNYFHLTNAVSSRNLFTQLIQLHFMALGKCIALRGKRHTLISHEMQSDTKILRLNGGINEGYVVKCPFLDGFTLRLRASFSSLLENVSELHLLSVVQALGRALVGVQEDCPGMYAITTGHADGEKVSLYVAASIDYFALLLENVTGRKRLRVVKRHVPSLTACLFSIILHIQSPSVFLQSSNSGGNDFPDPGSIIHMCIKVLIAVFGKHTTYQMESWHVSQSLHTPTAIFQPFIDLCSNSQALHGLSSDQLKGISSSTVDPLFSVDLYAACCQLLYTVLKHHKSESERCIHLLQGSADVLLHCLENGDASPVAQKGSFRWTVPETVKCASFMRRIYEEIRQQKDVFGSHSFKFLSSYVYTYSGLGPLRVGIRREVDEALRPGVYALIEVCSADDLQYLHTAVGEGACRNTLRTLLQDYKVKFQYEGKV